MKRAYLLLVFAIAGCAHFQHSSAPTVREQWDVTLAKARLAADSGTYDTADKTLADFIASLSTVGVVVVVVVCAAVVAESFSDCASAAVRRRTLATDVCHSAESLARYASRLLMPADSDPFLLFGSTL